MALPRYLVDTSAFARLSQPAVAAVLNPLVAQSRAVMCAPVAFELGFAADLAGLAAGELGVHPVDLDQLSSSSRRRT